MSSPTCSKFSKVLPSHAKYCPACGTLVGGPPPRRQEITVKVGLKYHALDGAVTVRVKRDDFEPAGATIAVRAPGGVEESDYLGPGDELTCTAEDDTEYIVRVLAMRMSRR